MCENQVSHTPVIFYACSPATKREIIFRSSARWMTRSTRYLGRKAVSRLHTDCGHRRRWHPAHNRFQSCRLFQRTCLSTALRAKIEGFRYGKGGKCLLFASKPLELGEVDGPLCMARKIEKLAVAACGSQSRVRPRLRDPASGESAEIPAGDVSV